jgi:tRNA modification GTPase
MIIHDHVTGLACAVAANPAKRQCDSASPTPLWCAFLHPCGKLSTAWWSRVTLEQTNQLMSSSEIPAKPPGETIFSVSSGQNRAGVAVIRISGPQADAALLTLAGRLPSLRVATLMTLHAPGGMQPLDRGLVLRFAEGASFTGEASVELQVHGGRAVVKSVLDALAVLPGLRLAEAGEFTRRALENGRLDLVQVEALGDLIAADTEQQRRLAVHGLVGAFGESVRQWRSWLIEARAIVAAEIDFSDEGDVGEDAASGIDLVLERLETAFAAALHKAKHGRIITDGLRVAIIGAPNVGKSTLLNALAGSDIAIVTEHAGTTRDVLEVQLDIEGFSVVLQDTAGLRDAVIDPVEKIGIDRARHAALSADLLLLLDDGEQGFVVDPEWNDIPSIRVRTKSDQDGIASHPGIDLWISAKTGAGLDSLQKQLSEYLNDFSGDELPLITRERQRIAIAMALERCRSARGARMLGIEFLDEELRRIDDALAGVVGMIGVEDILGAIFSKFCVGK